jgi:amidohydrolase
MTQYAMLRQQGMQLSNEIICWRRALHAMPELRMDTPKTEAYIARELTLMGAEDIRTGVGGHGITAMIRGDLPGKTLAIRADCDGLPIREETGLPFASTNGNMHACGHDAHTAMGLGAAKLLIQNRHLLHGTVKLIFQPFEEGDGGAKAMLADGVLDGVDAIVGLHNHVTPDEDYLPGDVLVTESASSANIFAYEATFRGPGGHVCHSRHLANPAHAACQAVAQIAELPEPGPETVNAVTVIQGGTRSNIVPTECTVAGSIRAFDETLHNTMRRQVMDILQDCGAASIATTIDVMGTRIDPGLLAAFRRTVNALYPERGWQTLKKRDMIGEDFARFAAEVPGIYFFLHTKPETGCYPLHHPKFDVNESVLHKGSELFAAFALDWQNET